MYIGQNDNFLSIEPVILEGNHIAYRVEATASASGRKFTASHDRLMLDSSDARMQQLVHFETLKTDQIEIPLSETGWLRFQRDSHGNIVVHYRIHGWQVSASMEGKIFVDGEFRGRFLQEFGALLRGQN